MKNQISKNTSNELKGSFKTIQSPTKAELIIKKSKFISEAFPLTNLEDAESFLQTVKHEFPDATHHCFAYVFGKQKEIYRFNDDGEPSGTAGKPILQTILNFDLTNVLVVVTRYFGGIKLGASGLIRAYSESAKLALASAILVEIQNFKEIAFETDYNHFSKIKPLIIEYMNSVEETYNSNSVEVKGIIAEDNFEKFKESLLNQTSGKIHFK